MSKFMKKMLVALLVACVFCCTVALTACGGNKQSSSEGGSTTDTLTYSFVVTYEDGTAATGAMVIACIMVEGENGEMVEGACKNYNVDAEGKASFTPNSATEVYHLKVVKGGYTCESDYYTEGLTKTYTFVLKTAE